MHPPVVHPISDRVISHYRIVGALGAGGMGEVYAAVDETLRRRVALKAIKPDRRLDVDAKARFLREARILSQLDHPHICRVYDYIEADDRDWLVLELIEGETLSDAIRRGLRREAALAIAEKIAAVLVATHAAGVIHRDLKPANVMLTRGGDVKVLDFGLSATVGPDDVVEQSEPSEPAAHTPVDAAETILAVPPRAGRPVDVSQFQSQAGGVKGTLGYMSPEQARGEVATPASDMYSFGLLLQELFTGALPYFESGDYQKALAQARRGDRPTPTGLGSDLSALLQRLKSPVAAERPTALDTADRLRWIREAPRRHVRNAAIAAVMVALMLGAVKYTVDLARERSAAVRAQEQADRRRDQAEDLIGFMLGDLRTKLTAVGRLEILDDVGQKALDYFGAVPVTELSNEELSRRSQAMHQLGQVRQARADLDGAQKAYAESLAQALDLSRREPDNAKWQLGLGTSHFYVGDLMFRRGDYDGALQHFRAYQEVAERLARTDPSNFEWKLEQSYGHSNVAAVLQRRGDLAGAREHLQTTARLQQELADRKPDDAPLQASRANNANRLGIVSHLMGDLESAVRHFRDELATYARLLARDPNNARISRRALVARQFLGRTLRAQGDDDHALAELQTAMKEADRLRALDAANADWQRDAAVARIAVGRLLVDRGDAPAGDQMFRGALALLGPLAQKSTAVSARVDLAQAHGGLAAAAFAQRRLETARMESDTALSMVDPLVASKTGGVEGAIAAATAENLRGLVAHAAGDATLATARWTRATELLWPHAGALSADSTVLDPLVRALHHLGRTSEAEQWFARLQARGYRDRAFLRWWATAQGSGLNKPPASG